MKPSVLLALIGLTFALGACADPNKSAKYHAQAPTVRYLSDGPRTQMSQNLIADEKPATPAPKYEQVQARLFEGANEARLIEAAAKSLETQGFEVDRSGETLGVLTARLKEENSAGNQFLQAFVLALFVGPAGSANHKGVVVANTTHAMVMVTPNAAERATEMRLWYDVVLTRKGEKQDTPYRIGKPDSYDKFFKDVGNLSSIAVRPQ